MPVAGPDATAPRPRRTMVMLLAALLAVGFAAACGNDTDDPGAPAGTNTPDTSLSPTPPASPSSTGSPASPAEDVELLEFEIAGGQASPPLERVQVDRGTTVRIVVTSDQPDEIHLHGYDLSAPVGPDEDGVIEFAADQTGLFELETHHTGLVLAQLQVQ